MSQHCLRASAWLGLGVSLFASQPAVPTTGLVVDTSSRNSVLAFWNTYYKASEGSEAVMGWDGNYQACNPGTNSLDHTLKVERRINFYRALAGLDASTLTNTGSTVVIGAGNRYKPSASVTKQAAAQQAALMFSWADQLSHDPSPGSPFACWTTSAWNGAHHSNLAIGFTGPEAIDAYMRENDPVTLSSWNDEVGHRRWILKHGATDFASGDVPGYLSQLRPANALYVVQSTSEQGDPPPRFTAWPSEGYFPDALMASHWSLSHPDADFSGASVTMTDGAGSIVVTSIVDRTTTGIGDPTIVWSVPAGVAAVSVAQDTTYQVVVSGIVVGGQTVSHSYQVTVFDPDVLTDSMALLGTTTPPLEGASYFFEPVEAASSHTVLASESEVVNWVAGAEDGSSDYIVDETDGGYALRSSSPYVQSGSKSFRLRLQSPSAGERQSFVIDREVIPGPGATVSYYRRRGYMASGELFELQVSTDGNVWTTIDSTYGRSSGADSSFSLRTASLTPGQPVRVRAVLSWVSGVIYDPSFSSTGIFLDGISFSNCEWSTSVVEVEADQVAGMVRIDTETLGAPPAQGSSLTLRLKSNLGGVGYVSPTPLTVIFGGVVTGFDDWTAANYPNLIGGFEDDPDGDGLASGLEYAFGLNPMVTSLLPQNLSLEPGSVALSTPLDFQRVGVVYQIEYSDDLATWNLGAAPVLSNGSLIGSAPRMGDRAFVRWRAVEP